MPKAANLKGVVTSYDDTLSEMEKCVNNFLSFYLRISHSRCSTVRLQPNNSSLMHTVLGWSETGTTLTLLAKTGGSNRVNTTP